MKSTWDGSLLPKDTKENMVEPLHNMGRQMGVRITIALGAMVLLAAPSPLPSTKFLEQFDVYFGNLHAHTTLSDGSGTPAEAYKQAKDVGLDFMAVTEHNHSEAENPKEDPAFGAGIASDHSLYRELTTAAEKANRDDVFVALFGQEFSTISSGNHVNVIGATKVIDENEVPSGDFRTFYEQWLPNDSGVQFIQFNHPWDNKKNPQKDYGLAQFNKSFPKVWEASKQWLRTIEVINGPGTINKTGLPAQVKGRPHYQNLLTRGFQIAPTGDQDNHHHTWGTLTDGRTGVLATRLTRRGVLDAIDKLRVYATTDKNLKVWFGIAGAVMGSDVEVDDRDVEVVVKIEDEDEPDATYKVTLVSGSPKVALQTDQVKLLERTGNGVSTATWRMTKNSAFAYVEVVQWPGDADARDNVLTSPVWITVIQN
jgi:hypothetical protein